MLLVPKGPQAVCFLVIVGDVRLNFFSVVWKTKCIQTIAFHVFAGEKIPSSLSVGPTALCLDFLPDPAMSLCPSGPQRPSWALATRYTFQVTWEHGEGGGFFCFSLLPRCELHVTTHFPLAMHF